MAKFVNFIYAIIVVVLLLSGLWFIESKKHYYYVYPFHDETKFLHYQGNKVQLCFWLDNEDHLAENSYTRDQLDNAIKLSDKEQDRIEKEIQAANLEPSNPNEPLSDEEYMRLEAKIKSFNQQMELINYGHIPQSKNKDEDNEPKLYCFKSRNIDYSYVPKIKP